MKKQAMKYVCDLCGRETDFSGAMGLSVDGGTLTYQAAVCGEKHICVSCWDQLKAMMKKFDNAVV